MVGGFGSNRSRNVLMLADAKVFCWSPGMVDSPGDCFLSNSYAFGKANQATKLERSALVLFGGIYIRTTAYLFDPRNGQ
jgi:hypothetical protein